LSNKIEYLFYLRKIIAWEVYADTLQHTQVICALDASIVKVSMEIL